MNKVEINGIYYNLNKCEKTAQVTEGSDEHRGVVSIPETVSYNGKTYTVTSIGDRAFWDCTGLTSVNIPDSVTRIEGTFDGCSGLTDVNIPDSITYIGDHAFNDCKGLTSVNIPNSVTRIGHWAFGGCNSLESVNIPNSVTSIEDVAFWGCSGLTSVNIPDSVTRIGDKAFWGCSGMTDVNIPNSVTKIGKFAFSYCKRLADVYCYAENMPSTERIVFNNSDIRKATLHVPAASIEQYKTTEPWSDFGTIVAIDEAETQASRPASKAWAAIIKAGMKVWAGIIKAGTKTINVLKK